MKICVPDQVRISNSYDLGTCIYEPDHVGTYFLAVMKQMGMAKDLNHIDVFTKR